MILGELLIAGIIFYRESLTNSIVCVSTSLGLSVVLIIYDLVFKTIRKVAQIEPTSDNKMISIEDESDVKDHSDISSNIRHKKSKSDLRESDLIIRGVNSEEISFNRNINAT
jgi:hypothetical protein